jgi:hypothetical protein
VRFQVFQDFIKDILTSLTLIINYWINRDEFQSVAHIDQWQIFVRCLITRRHLHILERNRRKQTLATTFRRTTMINLGRKQITGATLILRKPGSTWN